MFAHSRLWTKIVTSIRQFIQDTQHWVMEGILAGIEDSTKEMKDVNEMVDKFRDEFKSAYQKHVSTDGEIDWHGILREING